MFETIMGVIGNIISSIVSKDRKSGLRENYEAIRFEIATTLALYAKYYHNPVDLAQISDLKLPKDYAEASEKIRALASKTRALSEILPDKPKHAETKSRLNDVSACLFGLSNSLTTPFDCGITGEHQQVVDEYERQIKKLLKLSSGR